MKLLVEMKTKLFDRESGLKILDLFPRYLNKPLDDCLKDFITRLIYKDFSG